MPSLKDLKNRISSVKSTQKITKAMQMVAAAKLRKAQEAAESSRPYAERMNAVLTGLAAANADDPSAPELLRGKGEDMRHLLVVATAERGLCGGFNSSIARLARDHANKLMGDGKKVRFLCVGKKGYDVLKRLFPDLMDELITLRDIKTVGFADADKIGAQICSMFQADEFDVVTLFYAKFQSVIAQTPTAQQIIPADFKTDEDSTEPGSFDYEYEPSQEAILEVLLPQNISVQIFSALLENGASEQGARMSAMDNATRNAGEMIDKLTLSYNRQRQAQITKELIEIISGAEAL